MCKLVVGWKEQTKSWSADNVVLLSLDYQYVSAVNARARGGRKQKYHRTDAQTRVHVVVARLNFFGGFVPQDLGPITTTTSNRKMKN